MNNFETENESSRYPSGTQTSRAHKVAPTYTVALKVWWALMWRSIAYGMGVGIAVGIVFGILGAITGAAEAMTAISLIISLVLSFVMYIYVVYRLMTKGFGKSRYKLVLIERDDY